MTRVVNSFALLGDEEEDDVTVLVDHFAKKVDVTAANSAAESKKQVSQNQSEQASSERGRGFGGRGRIPARGGFVRTEEHFGNELERRNYFEGSNGSGYNNAYHGRGRGRGGNRGRGSGRSFDKENVILSEKEASGGNRNITEDASDGWQQVGQTLKGHASEMNNNWEEKKTFRNGTRKYGGERRGHGNGNHGFRGRHDGTDHAWGEQLNCNEVKETVDSADTNVVNVESYNAIAEGDVAPVTKEPTEVSAEEKVPEESVKADPAKEIVEEDEKHMTLEEYQKVFAEKRKALEALKNEERKVAADKDFEAMQLLAKKKEEDLLKPEIIKLKKKDIIEKDEKSRKTVSINEFLKPADGEKFFYRRPGRGGRGRGGGDFRNNDRDRLEQGGGGFRNRGRAEQGEIRNNVNGSEKGGLRSNGFPRGAKESSPVIHIEDQGQFPVLKATAPVV